jgi:hypothetical protein
MVQAGGGLSGGTNENGGTLTLASGISTGTGSSGINFNIYKAAGSTGTADNSATTAMTITGAGNVGIGTTSPVSALTVNNSNAITIQDNGATKAYVVLAPLGQGGLNADDLVIRDDATNIAFSFSGSEKMRITSAGSVGIGTTSPATAFDVNGVIAADGSSTITSAPPTVGTNVGWKLGFYGSAYAMGVSSYTMDLLSPYWVSLFNQSSGPANNASSTTPDTHATISFNTASGNGLFSGSVGIGTTAPNALLDVYGGSATYRGDVNVAGLFRSGGISTNDAPVVLGSINGNTPYIAAGQLGNGSNTPLAFKTSQTTRMVIDTSGNVGIGSTSPAVSLDISQKTDAVSLPVGTTGTRPTGVNGMIRYNSATPALEAYINGVWSTLQSSGTTSGVLGVANGGTGDSTLTAHGVIVGEGTSPLAATSAGAIDTVLVGNGSSSDPTFSASPTLSGTITDLQSIGSTSTDGMLLQNTTAAANNAQQFSPRVHFSGQGWKTTATAASQAVDMIEELQPIQGTTNPSGNLTWSTSVNGAAYSPLMTLTSGGNVGIGLTNPLISFSPDLA